MKVKIYVPDIECDSCITLLRRKFEKAEGIQGTKFHSDSVEVTFDEAKTNTKSITDTIQHAGYRASLQPFNKKNLKERKREFFEHKAKYALERNVIKYSLYIFVILSGLELIAYFAFLKNIPYFIEKYVWWFAYLNVSIATLGAALWHFFSYKAKTTCMLGMMIGMTLGMQTGMMLGAVLGATNGLFIGSVVGVITAVSIGFMTGKCCGIMGILQGMMAGLMGGIMGPMVTLMLFADHLLWFMPLYMLINILILWGFSYMIYEEMVENKIDVQKVPIPFMRLLLFSTSMAIVLITIMLYGIKSPLVGGY